MPEEIKVGDRVQIMHQEAGTFLTVEELDDYYVHCIWYDKTDRDFRRLKVYKAIVEKLD